MGWWGCLFLPIRWTDLGKRLPSVDGGITTQVFTGVLTCQPAGTWLLLSYHLVMPYSLVMFNIANHLWSCWSWKCKYGNSELFFSLLCDSLISVCRLCSCDLSCSLNMHTYTINFSSKVITCNLFLKLHWNGSSNDRSHLELSYCIRNKLMV